MPFTWLDWGCEFWGTDCSVEAPCSSRQPYRVRARAQPLQACLTLCGPKDCSLPGSSVRGILQTGVLEWASTPFPRGSSPPRDRTQVSCIAGAFFTSWTTREAPTSRVHATNTTHHSWFNLEHMAKVMPAFSTVQLLSFSASHKTFCGKKSLRTNQT